jgi:hypothetical protein
MAQHAYLDYPATELRKPRKVYTAKLARICTQLDANPSKALSFKHWFMQTPHTATVTPVSLWVVGSYARGALTCGDLDLVFNFAKTEGHPPGRTQLNRTFLGIRPDVRAYHGTPLENDSGVEFSEARLVWQPGMDWASAIAAILPNFEATRFARISDSIPLRSEQLLEDAEELTELAKLAEAGVLQWSFTPVNELEPVTLPLRPDDQDFMHHMTFRGAAQKALAPCILGYVQKMRAENSLPGRWDFSGSKTEVVIGGTMLRLGTSRVPVELLDNISTDRLVLAPYLSKRGPNGFWSIERGPHHPVTKAFKNVKGWALATPDGEHLICCHGAHGDCLGVDLLPTEEAAQEWAAELNNDEDTGPVEESETLAPKLRNGRELLALLASVDLVLATATGSFVPLTHAGMYFEHGDKAHTMKGFSALELAERLNCL